MLVRAARQSTRPHVLRDFKATCEQLYLPWLCPAYNQSRRLGRQYIATDAGSHGWPLGKRRNSRDSTSLSPRRSLATAVDHRQADDIPFEGLGQPQIASYGKLDYHSDSLTNIRPWDPSRAVILKNSLGVAPPHRHRNVQGISGELHDILLVLEACLQVGRIERAGVIIKRIANLQAVDPEEMLQIHNQYLKASLENILTNPNDEAAQAIHKWFELEIRNKELPMNAETVAYMLKASLQSPPGSRRDRLIRRYMDTVRGDAGLEVLATDILTAEELAHVTQIIPTYNFPVGGDSWIEKTSELEMGETLAADSEMASSESVPRIRPVQLKGLGLKALKQALSLFSDKPANFDDASLDREKQRERQTQLEQDAVSSAIDRWREENAHLAKMGFDTSLQTKSIGARMWRWNTALESYIRDELVKVEKAEASTMRTIADSERCIYGPFLRILSPEKLAAVTILACMTSFSTAGINRGMPLSNAVMVLGVSVQDESIAESIRKNSSKEVWEKLNGERSGGLARRLRRKSHLGVAESLGKLVNESSYGHVEGEDSKWDPRWSSSIKAKVGAFLMSALIETAKVPVTCKHAVTGEQVTQMQPAFSHAYQCKHGKKIGVILANPALVNALQREPVHSLLAKHLPMVVSPEPWTEFNRGGFILHPAKMMRIKMGDKDQRNYAEAAILKGDMEQMFKGLDVLGKTSWKINLQVFQTMLEAWNSGIAIANFPAADPQLEIPAEPEPSKDPTQRRRWMRAVKEVENLRGGYHSQRCFQNFQLEIAKALRDETFYFPHNVDFRGRAYPIPPYLNHMGADNCRGLLKFGKGKELGERGLKWLKIHLSNVYGYDKASLYERERFADDNLNEIFDSAKSPLTGRQWWLKAEDPWQCLAACFELKNALESPDPALFISHLPIHQDGTCNGLQHYAALGGDEWGARQVNLEPGDRPADVYSAVADLVKESLSNDLKKGNQYAKILDGKITRKVVKQTVMTNVYGVTFVGAKSQVKKQLVAAHPDLPNRPDMHPGILASYVATKIFQALSTMFRGAHDIQYWLGECASRISQSLTTEQMDGILDHYENVERSPKLALKDKATSFNLDEHLQFRSSVIWTNPLRMPVVQPYRTSKSRKITTNLQYICIAEPHRSDPINKRKQLQAFPPNFIHSLDATHMVLSALRCEELGLSFAAVHDSFWTHAADIDAMNGVLRDAFIKIHTEDVIGRLAAEFNARYKGGVYLAKIRPGTRLYDRINEWRKNDRFTKTEVGSVQGKFGATKMGKRSLSELMTERRRLRLLESIDPEKVAEGRRMVTPGSLFEELAAESDLADSDDLSALGIGQISVYEAGQEHDLDVYENTENSDLSCVDELEGSASADSVTDLLNHDDKNTEDTIPNSRGSTFEDVLNAKPRKRRGHNWQLAWLPLTFPEVPKKGAFDVSRLKNSQYFFS